MNETYRKKNPSRQKQNRANIHTANYTKIYTEIRSQKITPKFTPPEFGPERTFTPKFTFLNLKKSVIILLGDLETSRNDNIRKNRKNSGKDRVVKGLV